MKIIVLTQIFLALFCCLAARADSDAVFDALVDEMDRSMKSLHIDAHPLPYFISYSIKEVDEKSYSSCLGSESVINRSRDRVLAPIVRVGSYDLDSSYRVDLDPCFPITVDNDYSAIRRAVWLHTDECYKKAITNFEWKKAYLNSHDIPDRLPDKTREGPVVSISPIQAISTDDKRWCTLVQQLSALFKQYPSLQKSKALFTARTVNRWYVNSEGTRIRDSRPTFALRIWTKTQAPDGMPISDYEIVESPNEDKLPPYSKLKEITENLAERVSRLRQAPIGEEYCGPVLFEGQAAAEFFTQIMAPNFGFAEDYIGSESEAWRNSFKNALGRRVLPKYISVIDDPKAKEYSDIPLVGGYNFDDEGMPAQKVVLVENGILKGFCQSRIPTRHCSQSNGHSMGGYGVYNILQLSSSETLAPEELKSKLTELAKDAGLDYVLVVSRMADEFHMLEYPSVKTRGTRPYATPSYSRQPSNPVVVYRLYIADGKRELVRGLEFKSVSLRAFRDIQAVVADGKPYLVEPEDNVIRHIVTPSYLVGELELMPVKPEYSSPPTVPSPVVNAAQR